MSHSVYTVTEEDQNFRVFRRRRSCTMISVMVEMCARGNVKISAWGSEKITEEVNLALKRVCRTHLPATWPRGRRLGGRRYPVVPRYRSCYHIAESRARWLVTTLGLYPSECHIWRTPVTHLFSGREIIPSKIWNHRCWSL
jgi:hypothetical protein